MIEPQQRFMSDGQCFFGSHEDPNTITHCNVWDWDQLRYIKLKGTAKLFPPEMDAENEVLAKIADLLPPEVTSVNVDNDGLIYGISVDQKEDDTIYLPYIPFSMAESLAGCRTIQFSKLKELDRIGPNVDLSLYEDESGVSQKVVFKFNAWPKELRHQMAWKELNILRNLPSHPNLMSLDRVVLEDAESQIIGFTTKHIPDGTLESSHTPFRLEWLKQLTDVVDFLNLELGIMHQDIAPRNLLIDPDTDKLILFDFDRVAQGNKGLSEGRDDVTGVIFTLYELITNDTHFTEIPHWERSADMVQNISDWPCNRTLDADVSTFRGLLNEWAEKRNFGKDLERYLSAPNRLTWPDLPVAPDLSVPFLHGKTAEGDDFYTTGIRTRRTALKLGRYCFRWERPPQCRLVKAVGDGEHVVAESMNAELIIQ